MILAKGSSASQNIIITIINQIVYVNLVSHHRNCFETYDISPVSAPQFGWPACGSMGIIRTHVVAESE